MNDIPTISIIMPVYNGEKYLKEAIDSILNQTYYDFEFIILNDGSTDATEKIILSYTDNRIIYIKNKHNLKIVKTLNKGIKLAKGSYIARMDADDICLLNRLEVQINFIQKNPNIDICGSWVKMFGDSNKIWKPVLSHDKIKVNLLFSNTLAHPSVLGKKDFFLNLMYDEQYVGAEDYNLWVRGINSYSYANIPLVLVKYRMHISTTNSKQQILKDNNCKINMLEQCNCNLTKKELDIFIKALSADKIEFKTLAIVLSKILKANKKSDFFKQKILLEKLAGLLFNTIAAKGYSLSLFFQYRRSKIIEYIPFSLLSRQYIKFFIKCLIGYKNKA